MDGTNQIHKWPIRRYIEPSERVGMTTEPAGHNPDGEPLYTVYDTACCETRVITELEVVEMIEFLKNPRRYS